MAPARVLVMRHAEKPDEPGDPNLSEAGRERAKRLADWIPETLGPPDFIFATARSKESDRPVETIRPLARKLGLGYDDKHDDKDYGKVAQDVLTKPKYDGRSVLICWHHGHIPDLMQALGAAAGSYPEPWPSDVFDLVLAAAFPVGKALPSVTETTEPF